MSPKKKNGQVAGMVIWAAVGNKGASELERQDPKTSVVGGGGRRIDRGGKELGNRTRRVKNCMWKQWPMGKCIPEDECGLKPLGRPRERIGSETTMGGGKEEKHLVEARAGIEKRVS